MHMKPRIQKYQIFQYTAIFEEDSKERGYTVTIPGLPGCISEGETFEAAYQNIKEAAELYLDVMKQRATAPKARRPRVILAAIEVAA